MSAPWRSLLARALHHHREPHARYVQLATVSAGGMPHNRTIVFRGFLGDSDVIRFITDKRSAKIEDIKINPHAEVCWYFPKTREQFRLAGRLSLIDYPDQDRLVMWQELSARGKAQFLWPKPGEVRQEGEFLKEYEAPDPPDTFCLLLFYPIQLDYLNLRGNPQTRRIYQYQDQINWTTTEVNP